MKNYKVGDKVLLKKAVWGNLGDGLQLVDTEGVVESIKPDHSNIHKYCIKHSGGRVFTHNKPNMGNILFKNKQP